MAILKSLPEVHHLLMALLPFILQEVSQKVVLVKVNLYFKFIIL